MIRLWQKLKGWCNPSLELPFFQYQTLINADDDKLNELGSEGWELISKVPNFITYASGGGPPDKKPHMEFTFKREL